MDKTTSYKFVGGKLVARTAEEHAKLVELRNAGSHNKPGKAARSKESFIMISQAQQERLDALGLSPCMRLFMALLWEDFRHRGRAFPLLTGKVLDPQAQRRALFLAGGGRADLGAAKAAEGATDPRPVRHPVAAGFSIT